MSKPILCVDFDGVIHSYTSKWERADLIPDPPVPGALAWLWKATEWFEVHVYSSRSKSPAGLAAMRHWLLDHATVEFGADHPMAAIEDHPLRFSHDKPAAFLTIDDRALCFDGDWDAIDPTELLDFKPWNKRGVGDPRAAAARSIFERAGLTVEPIDAHCWRVSLPAQDGVNPNTGYLFWPGTGLWRQRGPRQHTGNGALALAAAIEAPAPGDAPEPPPG